MLLKVLEIDGIKYATACTLSDSGRLTFYCHNEDDVQSFMEALPIFEFKQRLVALNSRIKFPDEHVRSALLEDEPSLASWRAEPNADGFWVLSLKYLMSPASPPLKWEWHLKPMDTDAFYRQVIAETMEVGHELLSIVEILTKDLCAKDKELEQYRREGCQLRRTTVKTKTFDLMEFNEENKEVLEQAATYNDMFAVFPSESPSKSSHSRTEVSSTPSTSATGSSSSPSSKASERASSSSCTNAQASPSSSSTITGRTGSTSSSNISETPGYSPSSAARSKKRKAQAMNIDRLERKIKQRIQNPEVKFQSQSSQEDDLVEWLAEGAAHANGVKKETNSEPKPMNLTTKIESKEALCGPKAEVKTEKADETTTTTTTTTVPEEEENNNETLTESDQELNELRSILAASMAENRQKREKK